MIGTVHLILTLGVLPGSLTQTIHVWQIPVISASEGTSVSLPCDYNITGENATIGSYKWYRHHVRSNVEISENNMNFSGRLSRVDLDEFIHERSAAITLHSVLLSDSAMYYCEVTFQIGQEVSGHGEGTFLNVTGLPTESEPFDLKLYIYVGAAGGALLLALSSAVIYYLCRNQVCSSIQDAGPIVYTDFMTQRSTNEAPSRLATATGQPVNSEQWQWLAIEQRHDYVDSHSAGNGKCKSEKLNMTTAQFHNLYQGYLSYRTAGDDFMKPRSLEEAPLFSISPSMITEQACEYLGSSLYSMENQHYTDHHHRGPRQKPYSPYNQEMELYTIVH